MGSFNKGLSLTPPPSQDERTARFPSYQCKHPSAVGPLARWI